MKKFKDFLYDKNDIIIALLILVAATLIIIWRMEAIMEYPKEIIGTDDSNIQEPAQTPDDDSQTDAPGDDDNSDSSDADTDSDADSGSLWENDVLSRSIEVTIKGDSASAAIQCLVDAELFKDYAEYQSTCTALGLDHQKVSAGTFTFEKGWSKSDIAKAVNWG